MDVPRIKSSSLTTEMVSTHLVPIAHDNLVCVICDAKLPQDGGWAIISHPERKGILVFACNPECGHKAMRLLSKLL